jgi:3-methyladenine DNA glycosylase/8-oxoguanine DNA glycosylase
MLDRLRCLYGRYVCTVKLSTHVSSSSKVITDCWRVTYEKDNGQSVRDELARSIDNKNIDPKSFQSPQTTAKKRSGKTKGAPTTQNLPFIHHIFEFPTIETLALASEAELISLGMGYRAKFIHDTASILATKEGGGRAWLNGLRDMGDSIEVSTACAGSKKIVSGVKRIRDGSMKEDTAIVEEGRVSIEGKKGSSRLLVRKLLMEFPGVGPKVADCVALFSLNQSG